MVICSFFVGIAISAFNAFKQDVWLNKTKGISFLVTHVCVSPLVVNVCLSSMASLQQTRNVEIYFFFRRASVLFN